ncbi:MAG TPA: hypothetical protein VLV16_07955 [Gemmatimonadales bacterium]|nr:hypothetical protein [Gemmatimonadales bacterium]
MRSVLRNERGIALVVVLLVVLAIAAVAAGAALLGSSTSLITTYHSRMSVLETAADAGLEEARSAVNASRALYPDTGYNTLENGVAVYSANGTLIPNVKRWTYLGPVGVTSGQFGVFGSAVVVTKNTQGDRVVRRGEIYQESFAKYAYFTNIEGAIQFGSGDQIFGPVFSNDAISINSGGVTFWGPVATHKTISGKSYGVFKQGYTENAPAITFPATADLTKLQAQATIGNTAITSTTSGTAGQATTRIEFVAVDLNGDGTANGVDEGFMRVYQVVRTPVANYAAWVVADTGGYSATGVAIPYSSNGVLKSRNCGHILAGTHSYFKQFAHHAAGTTGDLAGAAITGGTSRRCYLGGDPILNDSIPASSVHGKFLTGVTSTSGTCSPANSCDSVGMWLPWSGAVDPRVTAARAAIGDAAYLWPVNRALNPNFKGVIFVTGKVAVSGTVRGQITLAATDNIVIADDIKYVTDPGVGLPCASPNRDMLGLFSGTDIVVADNLINDPIPAKGSSTGCASSSCTNPFTWDDTMDEFIQGTLLALSNFTVENYDQGSNSAEPCQTLAKGRGCLYLTGGVIQQQRGAVGTASGTGNLKRYSYDQCAATNPPPYFPTTGHFAKGHYYEVEPTNFNIATYWPLLVPLTH